VQLPWWSEFEGEGFLCRLHATASDLEQVCGGGWTVFAVPRSHPPVLLKALNAAIVRYRNVLCHYDDFPF
jgi:hypothetical protein